MDSMVRGFHIYKDVCNPVVGDILMCQREFGNLHDPYTVTVVCDHAIEKLFVAEINFANRSKIAKSTKITALEKRAPYGMTEQLHSLNVL